MGSDNILLSIIIPTYNSESSLAEALHSITNQAITSYEIIIIDNLSEDHTLDIIKSFASIHDNISWVSEHDNGIYDAMNKGINMARGEWLYFMGSDDKLWPGIFESIDPLLFHKNDFIYGNVVFKGSGTIYCGEFNFYKLITKNICHQTIFFKKEVFKTLGLYETKYKTLADWHFNMKIFHCKHIVKLYVNKNIAIFNENGLGFKYVDKKFYEDFKENTRKYFPLHIRFYYNQMNTFLLGYFIRLITKFYEK